MTTFKELLEAIGVIFLFQALLCATLVVALAWEHHPKGIVSYYRRRRAERKKQNEKDCRY